LWAMDSAVLSREAVSLVACTRQVARLPRSVQSTSTRAPWRSPSSNKLHLAARFRWPCARGRAGNNPAGQTGQVPRPETCLLRNGGRFRARECQRSAVHRWRPEFLKCSLPKRRMRTALPHLSAGIDWAKGLSEIDGGGKTSARKARKVAIEGPAQLLLISGARLRPR
jgi:hypothetical protein